MEIVPKNLDQELSIAAPVATGRRMAVLGGNPVTTILFISLSILATVSGQLVLKRGMTALGAQSISTSTLFDLVWRLGTNPWVILGIAIYISGTFFWLMVLSRVDLSFAYPLTSTSYIFIVASSWYFLGEPVSLLRIAGVMTICTGVLLVSQS